MEDWWICLLFVFQSKEMYRNEEIEYQLAAKQESYVWMRVLHRCDKKPLAERSIASELITCI